jgi:tricorn protease
MTFMRPWEGREEPAPRPYLRAPHCSPDGEQIAFVYAGDIWSVPRGGETSDRQTARLLVSHSGYNDRPRFSPDGRRLAFTSRRTGNGDLYCLDEAGGIRRLTHHDGFDGLECWSADGAWLWFTASRSARGTGLYQVSVEGGAAFPIFEEPYEAFSQVALAPDGQRLALMNNGDPWWRRGPNPSAASQIWIARVEGPGHAPRDWEKVVDAPCRNAWPMWRPDGAGLFFISDRDGVENLWYQSLEGGAHPSAEAVTHCREGRMLRPCITPDGREVLFERDFGLWCADLRTGEVRPLEIRVHPVESRTPTTHFRQGDRLSDLALSPDGRKVIFIAHGKLFADFADKTDRPRNDSFPVSDTASRESQPSWHPSSTSVVYLSDRDGESDLYRYDFITREEKRLTQSDGPCYAPQHSPDGKLIAYYQRPDEIRLLETETGRDRPFIRFRFPFAVPGHPSFTWSPDSHWLAFGGQNERFFANVYVQRIDETEARPVTFLSNIELSDILWSPDGRFILFSTGHHRVESQVARVDLRPPAPRFREEEFARLFEAPRPPENEKETERRGDGATVREAEPGPSAPSGSPPARAEEEPANGQESTPVPAAAPSPPEPVEIVFEGIRDRLRFLTPVSLHCAARRISPDGKQLVYVAHVDGKPNLWARSLEEERRDEPATQLTATTGGKGAVWFAPDGKKIHFLDDSRIYWRPFPKGDVKSLEVAAEFDVDFHREKRHIFREAWSLMRDHFYDPNFHGADWNALFLRFWPVILGATRTEDLHEMINLMVGELRASHLGAGGGEEPPNDGYLGLLFDPAEQAATGALRVVEVLADGPAAVVAEPVRAGEYLVAIDGEPIGPEVNLWQRLRYRVGKRVLLSLNDRPERERAREVAVRPINAQEHDRLRYREWVRGNAAYVDRVSQGRLGYVHVRAMTFDCYTQLLVDLDAQTHGKEGVVVDVRFNGGGYVAPFILDLLQRRSYDRSVYRKEIFTSSVNLAGGRILDRPTIVITNEHSGSNTEMFSEGYRTLGLGQVVGRPTMGAVIWTWGWQFLDGSWFRLPRIEVQTLAGENLEGAARPVDFDVEQPIGEWHPDPARRRDRQLDEAVHRLFERIERSRS